MDAERLQVYAYATAPEAADYVTIMRRLTATLLAEWSAQDLIERGLEVRPEIADSRLRYLAAHGNLIESPREVRVSSIAEYQRQPARYSVTAVGAVVHRQVEEVLAASGGAREVPRELLEAVAAGIDRLVHGAHAEGDLSGRDLAELVSTIFLQFEAFATAIADFYSYVGAVLARPDLDGDEWLGFKALLLDYLETIVRSVALHTPAIRRGIARLDPMLDDILLRVDAIDPQLNELRSAAGADIDRARGRSRPDWEELRAWFGEDGDRHAGAAQLRAAAGRAVGTLLIHLKRLNAAGTREESMRRHLLRLAGWFGAASPADAHDLFTAAFRLHGARHFGVVLDDEVGALVPATASWWTAPTAPVPVSLIAARRSHLERTDGPRCRPRARSEQGSSPVGNGRRLCGAAPSASWRPPRTGCPRCGCRPTRSVSSSNSSPRPRPIARATLVALSIVGSSSGSSKPTPTTPLSSGARRDRSRCTANARC